jgi:hypothetical protein
MAKDPVRIERQADGRHHVMDAEGQVLGKHNSVFSAARQVHEYHTPPKQKKKAPPVPRPTLPRPPESTAPVEGRARPG